MQIILLFSWSCESFLPQGIYVPVYQLRIKLSGVLPAKWTRTSLVHIGMNEFNFTLLNMTNVNLFKTGWTKTVACSYMRGPFVPLLLAGRVSLVSAQDATTSGREGRYTQWHERIQLYRIGHYHLSTFHRYGGHGGRLFH